MLQIEGSENIEELKKEVLRLNQNLKECIGQHKTLRASTPMDGEFNENFLFSNPLMDSAELFRQIVDTANEGIWVCDLNSRLIFSNRKGAEMLGYTSEELIGRSVFDFVSQEGITLAEGYFERRKQGFNDQYEQRLVRKSGSVVWVTITASPIKDRSGNVVGVLGMLNDISQHKIAELALRKSEEKFAAAFRTNPSSLAITDVETGTFLEVNETFLAIFERTRNEVIGKTSQNLNIYANPDDRQRIIEILKNDGKVTNHELQIRVPSGKIKVIKVSAEKLPIENYEVMLTTIQDVTELKLTQNNLKQSEEHYRQLVDSANSIIVR